MPDRRRCLRIAALCLLAAMAPLAAATPSEQEHKLIMALIARVQGMTTMKFLRNNEAHNAAEAAEHMQAKYKHFRNEIVTAEDFIERCASRSEVTGKPYMVTLADGKALEARGFLMQELHAMRQQGRSRTLPEQPLPGR
ncbi:DUF5329 family protein [Variovorax sp. RA8]|uniref:DUF5329 family protein n=1 Tax=Variovorax sp. (strain JCM 16519 / RA8) TaxID=662548 RepID=UPI001316B3D6|nr:DUF5329 family protein [Variovorax sp. RA8]VTU15961.1 hypothetical protein RA8CHR_01150 [Variovorax sp. RA8]